MTLTIVALWVLVLYALPISCKRRADTASICGKSWVTAIRRRKNPLLPAGWSERRITFSKPFPSFITLTALNLSGPSGTAMAVQGALIFLLARVVYVPAYVSGIPMLRSMIWLVANGGLIAMALPLLGW